MMQGNPNVEFGEQGAILFLIMGICRQTIKTTLILMMTVIKKMKSVAGCSCEILLEYLVLKQFDWDCKKSKRQHLFGSDIVAFEANCGHYKREKTQKKQLAIAMKTDYLEITN